MVERARARYEREQRQSCMTLREMGRLPEQKAGISRDLQRGVRSTPYESSNSYGLEPLVLPSGITVNVPKAKPTFHAWSGIPPSDTYGNKCILDFDGRMAFAELVILWSLEQAGWSGVWIDTYRNKYRHDYWGSGPVTLPATAQALLDRIIAANDGVRAGTWDVFCWKDLSNPDVTRRRVALTRSYGDCTVRFSDRTELRPAPGRNSERRPAGRAHASTIPILESGSPRDD